MTIEELKKGYVNEVNYQKKMLKNLKSWFNLFFMISTIGVVLIYYYHAKNSLVVYYWYSSLCFRSFRYVDLWLWTMEGSTEFKLVDR